MAIKINENIITIKEIQNIAKQIIEQRLKNKPDINITCPRCGEQMILDEVGSSHSVKCENENCIEYTARGI